MNLQATIAKMRACGMSAEAILLALECVVVDPAIPEKSGAARRQAAYRERVKERNALRNVDNDVTEKEGFDKESFHTFKEITSKKKINTTRARPKTDLPEDWQPNPATWALADELGFNAPEIQDQIQRMRDWSMNAGGEKGRKSDWDAAFRNWLKRAADDRQRKPQATQRKPSMQDGFAILDAVTDEAIRRAGGLGAESREEDSGSISRLWESAA